MYASVGEFAGRKYRIQISGQDDSEGPTVIVESIRGVFINGAILPIEEGKYDLKTKASVDRLAETVLEEACGTELDGMSDCDYTLLDWRPTEHPELYSPKSMEILNEFFKKNLGLKPYEGVEAYEDKNKHIVRTFDNRGNITTPSIDGERIDLRIVGSINSLKGCRPEFGNREQISAILYLGSEEVGNYLKNFWDYRVLKN